MIIKLNCYKTNKYVTNKIRTKVKNLRKKKKNNFYSVQYTMFCTILLFIELQED